jgi:hypothetical protein
MGEPLHALIDRVDPAWPIVEGWLSTGLCDVVLVERDAQRSEETLLHLQASTHSILGALAYECGGLVVDSRVRVLGGGTAEVHASLKSWNGLPGEVMPIERGMVRVGFDAFGGVFALDGGALGPGDGMVHYFAPDSLAWEPLELGHSAWLHWLITEPDQVAQFYDVFTWADWKLDLSRLTFDQALSLTPPPWSPQHKDLVQVTRRAAPAAEVVKELFEAARKKN